MLVCQITWKAFQEQYKFYWWAEEEPVLDYCGRTWLIIVLVVLNGVSTQEVKDTRLILSFWVSL